MKKFVSIILGILLSLGVLEAQEIEVGAKQEIEYFSAIKGKSVGIVANQSTLVDGKHLVDVLVDSGVEIAKIYSPEHGFRGKADAGEHVSGEVDGKTGISIFSLYGKNKRMKPEHIEGIDVMIFDLQDVGARFYTYISTMHYVMEACAVANIPLIVLDRPNPNGFYVDGPVLEMEYQSFVGMHPVPVVHGMTVAEYAQMINGEFWLKDSLQCELICVKCKNYAHTSFYELPIKPSPNLPNMSSVYLYPSLCFFEGTVYSVGRGTDFPFQIYGHPQDFIGSYVFTPTSREGAKSPKHENEQCFGARLTETVDQIKKEGFLNLSYLLGSYQHFAKKDEFFISYFEKLAGNDRLRKQIEKGKTEGEIRESWQKDLNVFKAKRKKYLLYKDFE